jgi:ADP-L-glycero-D-manno-heptose 6-epimerase
MPDASAFGGSHHHRRNGKMRCLVTGGTGFIGSQLVRHLVENGHEVVITGHEAEQPLPFFAGKRIFPGLFGIDWKAVGRIDVLFHQAALNDTRCLDRGEMMRSNLDGSKALFDYAVRQGCRRIVYASSTAVYGRNAAPYRESNPCDLNTPYAESKKAMEDAAQEIARRHPGVRIVGLRYCNVYGPGESHKGRRASMIYQCARQMQYGNPRLFKYGRQRRDYIYVKDVVRANMLAAEAEESGIVNCGCGSATSFNRVVEILNEVLGCARRPEYFDNPYADNYQDHTECDMTLAEKRIGFVPRYRIEEGIRDYFRSGYLTDRV